MELIKNNWTKPDMLEFYNFEKTLIGTEKECLWEQKIVNTKLKCYGKTSAKAKELVKQIKKGNFISFIDNLKITSHLDSLLCAYLICEIKDFPSFSTRLDKYVPTIDNWASCDTLKFQKKDYEKLFSLSKKYLQNAKPFVRRVGLNIYFELIKDEKYLPQTFKVLDNLNTEKEYYVNMCGAWLLSDCFARYRDETLNYLKINKTNSFIINKAISKCRDSFRVSKEDKEILLSYKK